MDLDENLAEFIEASKPNEGYLRKGEQCVERIVKMLKANTPYKIQGHFIGGSVGKKTATKDSDFDCFLFIDDIEHPYSNVLDDLAKFLARSDSIIIGDVSPTVINCTANEEHCGYFKIDLSIAKNFVTHDALNANLAFDSISIQQKCTLDVIKRCPPKFIYKMNAGLATANVRFVECQDPFTRNMIRLTKIWLNKLNFNQMNSKSMFEVLTVFVAKSENDYPTKSITRCLLALFKLLENFNELDIVFRDAYIFPEHTFDENTKLPRVMDPVNPYRNLAEFWKSDTKDLLKKYAIEATKRINQFPMAFLMEDFQKVKPPQPYMPKWFTDRGLTASWLIEFVQDERISVDVVVLRKQKLFGAVRFSEDFGFLAQYFNKFVNEFIDSAEQINIKKLAERVRALVATSFVRSGPPVKISLDKNREFSKNYDVNIKIPVYPQGSFIISFRD